MSPPPSPAGGTAVMTSDRPTRARYWVVVFAVSLAMIQYIDRICISKAEPFITRDLGLTTQEMGWVFSAFTLAYALFEIPTGSWGDRVGPRRVLLRVVLWWSFFTAATGWVRSLGSLIAVRFLFGAGEAGCFPNLTRAFEHWLPRATRVRAQAIMWMSARWGGALTPLLVLLVLRYVDWRNAFLVFGLLGVAWAVAFGLWFRDDPRKHPSVNAAEAALLPSHEQVMATAHFNVPWRRILRSPSIWMLCGQYFACSYAFYFLVTWFPRYLHDVHNFDLTVQSALLAGLPLFLGGCGSMITGALAPVVQRWTGSVAKTRRYIGTVGFLGAAVCLFLATVLDNPYAAVGVIAFASLCNDLTLPLAWASCMDVGGRYVGTVSGAMNMIGNVGGFLSPIVLGYIVGGTGNWNLTFFVTAAIYLLGAACWWFMDPTTPLERQQKLPV